MSEAPERESKTEDATPRKLEQAAQKGDGPRTMDLGSVATLSAVSAVVLFGGNWLSNNMVAQLTPFLSRPQSMSVGGNGPEILKYAIMAGAPALVLVMFAAAIAGLGSGLAQGGLHIMPDKLKPDFSKVSPVKGFERLFGPDGLMQFAKSIVKVVLFSLVGWWILGPVIPQLSSLSALAPIAMLPFAMEVIKRLIIAVALLALVIAGADWFWQRQRFLVRMRMTKEEVKEDYKQSEGDPHVRARQKQIRYERARRRMMQAVPGATVVVMNPTHFAVAIRYDEHSMRAPQVISRGADLLALKIRDVAQTHAIPVVQAPMLARALYAHAELGQDIPASLYTAVAQVLAYVYRLKAALRGDGPMPDAPPAPEVPPELDPQANTVLGAP